MVKAYLEEDNILRVIERMDSKRISDEKPSKTFMGIIMLEILGYDTDSLGQYEGKEIITKEKERNRRLWNYIRNYFK